MAVWRIGVAVLALWAGAVGAETRFLNVSYDPTRVYGGDSQSTALAHRC